MASVVCVGGSPGGHRRECFLRYLHPSKGSFISWRSSIIRDVPFHLILGLAFTIGLGEFLLSSEAGLSLLCDAGSIVKITDLACIL